MDKDNNLSLPYKIASVGLSLFFSRKIAAVSSGAALNPNIALGLELANALANSTTDPFKGFYIYIIGPLAGGALAGLLFKYGKEYSLHKEVEK